MALIECPECGAAVSDAARACPYCGYPIKKINIPEISAAKEGAKEAAGYIQKKLSVASDEANKKLETITSADISGKVKKMGKENKQVVIWILCVAMFFGCIAGYCLFQDSKASTGKESTKSAENSDEDYIASEAEIKTLAEAYVIKEIENQQSSYSTWNADIDPYKCRVEVSTIDFERDKYHVYGNGWFYSKYGKITTKYSTSGSYTFEFTAVFSKYGLLESIKID